jgi:hypothetical protein
MIPSGLTAAVIGRVSIGEEYVRVHDSGLVTAVEQFLYDEAALLDEWRLDEWLALFHPKPPGLQQRRHMTIASARPCGRREPHGMSARALSPV